MKKKWFFIVPLAILAMLLFIFIGGEVVMHLVTILTGGVVLFVHGTLGLVLATACYIAVTALFYRSSR